MSDSASPFQPICVTGASGFLGSWIVYKCLQRGYEVHATTRKLPKAQFLKAFPNAEKLLKIFEGCDFEHPGAFETAIKGCNSVIHCASPFFNAGGTRDNLVEPAVTGTEMVLNLCDKLGVKYVTLTASSACVIVDYGTKVEPETENYVYTDADFSPRDLLEEKKNWYALSKLLAELKAWECAKEHNSYKLCVLNPSLIWGPMTVGQTHLNTSSQAILQYMDGSHKLIQNGCRCVVDVRDVAEAHIVPLERNVGWGKRFLLFGGAPHFEETAKYVRQALEQSKYPRAKNFVSKVPTEVDPQLQPTVMGPPADKPLRFDASPAKKVLGIDFHSVQDMVTTCVEELLANGFSSSSQYDPKFL